MPKSRRLTEKMRDGLIYLWSKAMGIGHNVKTPHRRTLFALRRLGLLDANFWINEAGRQKVMEGTDGRRQA